MITSFSRLFRQIFGGSRAQPATEAPTRDVGAEREAREAAEHRENLKRAMEVAFATPTASADGPQAPPVAELLAAAEEAATAIATPASLPESDGLPAESVEVDHVDEAYVVEPVAEEVETAPEPQAAEPVAAELPPAIELAEVEAAGEHDVEVVEWDVAKLTDESGEAAPPVAQDLVAVERTEVEETAEESVGTAAADAEPKPEEADAPAVSEQLAASEPAELEPAPALTQEFVAAAAKPKRTKKTKAPAKKKSSTAKKKTAAKKTSALPDDAVWLSDAIAFSLKGEWSNVWTPPEDASGAERLEAFREKAATGDLVVWGRPEGAETWEPVKAAYWKTALVEPLSFLLGRENVSTDASASKAKKPVTYTALKVAQADVEALWPPATPVRDAA